MATQPAGNPYEQSLNDRVRQNIKLLKTFRGLSDAVIAERAGYSSRQQVADRIGTRTEMSLTDVDRISAALQVDRMALLAPPDEMLSWVTSHPIAEPEPAPVEPPKPSQRSPRKRTTKATSK